MGELVVITGFIIFCMLYGAYFGYKLARDIGCGETKSTNNDKPTVCDIGHYTDDGVGFVLNDSFNCAQLTFVDDLLQKPTVDPPEPMPLIVMGLDTIVEKYVDVTTDDPDDGTCISFGVDVDKSDVYISPPADIIVDDDPPGWPVDYTLSKNKPS